MAKLGTLGPAVARLLGAVLLLAAYAKAIDPQGAAERLRDVLPVPSAIAYPGALGVVAFEGGLGAALLGGSRRRGVLLLGSATFLAFVAIVAWQLVRPGGPAACGCFGQLLERTPWQALYEDVGFAALSGLAWLGGPQAPGVRPGWPSALGAGAGVAFALCAPWLPLDDHATALAPGVTVEATQLDRIVPELRTGRNLVLLLDRADAATRARIPHLNERLKLPHGGTPVWGVADDDPALAAAFLWSAGPAFEVRSAPPPLLRRLYRTLPRSALVDGGRVVATWTGFPPDATLDALARGDPP
ncbi:MAG TPA: MauE/DoxX family redox-associated membrane protein [Candidatus Binatia bacterium]|nr:MauE/DoxX family redox-associated membrane protein [Candidatus Binatia bacterium]